MKHPLLNSIKTVISPFTYTITIVVAYILSSKENYKLHYFRFRRGFELITAMCRDQSASFYLDNQHECKNISHMKHPLLNSIKTVIIPFTYTITIVAAYILSSKENYKLHYFWFRRGFEFITAMCGDQSASFFNPFFDVYGTQITTKSKAIFQISFFQTDLVLLIMPLVALVDEHQPFSLFRD